MTRGRRSLLAALAGGVGLLAGCSSGDEPETRTPDDGTPTVAFTRATASATSTDPPTRTATETDAETETPDAVGRALVAARADVETAISRLDAAAVVEDGDVGLVTADAFAEYAGADDPRPPIREARERLDFVSDRARGDRRRAVNGLLFCCAYLETRAAQHDAIVDGFSSFYEANAAFPAELKFEAAERAVGDMRDLREQVETAHEALDRVAPWADALGIDGFALAAARDRQRTFRAIGREFDPAFGGTLSMLRTVGLVSAAGPAIERGDYAQAEEFATNAATAARTGVSVLDRAFERDVRHFRDVFRQDRCVCGGMQTVGERYRKSARAYLDDRPETGREQHQAATDALRTIEEECGIEL